MNTPVSYELAKLLKEKGFDEQWNIHMYTPTIADVVMWMHKKHGIWITCHPSYAFKYWSVNLVTNKAHHLNLFDATLEFNSPTEAYEAAIMYFLNGWI